MQNKPESGGKGKDGGTIEKAYIRITYPEDQRGLGEGGRVIFFLKSLTSGNYVNIIAVNTGAEKNSCFRRCKSQVVTAISK